MYQKTKILSILSLNLLFGGVHGFAQYSHFPITHLDWEIIDFEEPSRIQSTSVFHKPAFSHSSHVKWEHSSTAKHLLKQYELPTENETDTQLPRSFSVELSEPIERKFYEFLFENHEWVASLDLTDYSLSSNMLGLLHAFLETDKNSSRFTRFKNSQDCHSWIGNPKFPIEQEYETSAISSNAIIRIAHPFHHSPPLSTNTVNISNNSNYIPTSKSNKISTMPNKRIEENYSRLEPIAFFDIFAAKFDEEILADPPLYAYRQRRANYTYVWEMTDFTDYDNSSNDILIFNGNFSDDNFTIVIKPLTGGAGVGTGNNGQDENTSATQGIASNMPVFPDNGIWSPSTRTYSSFLQFNSSNIPTVNIDASAVKYFMNWHYGDWHAVQNDNNFNLVYYSAAPEPSTYVMTGALLCFIGLNGRSRKASKQLIIAILKKLKFRQSEKNSSQINLIP